MEDNQQIINYSRKKYDVFLSFRGEDTRYNFISYLYDALRKEVETYIDYRLETGDEISQALIQAIQDSHVSVVIFSENYAASKWCLDELTEILKCRRDDGQIVIPVFYRVDPSDVRKQTGKYKEAFEKHEQDLKNSDDKLPKWRCALTEAANLAGCHFKNDRNESELIEDIVRDVLQKLKSRYPIERLKGIVGIEENYAGLESLLEIGSEEVRVIGIWGMGGIGKTTLARELYAKLLCQFEGHCFLQSVREQLKRNGLDALRNKLFSKLLEEENLVESQFVMRRLRRKKVLIVLDDVTTSKQLKDLISDCDCLTPGSRVIVTTRDKHIFSEVNGIYEVKGLNNHDSLQLFCLNAFGGENPKQGYEELSRSVIANCKGNPLALIVLGARLQSRGIEEWKSELKKLRKILDGNIHDVLKLSFDDLDFVQKDIFLDIACIFKGELRSYVTSLLDSFGFFAAGGIKDLIDKSLITVSEHNCIEMHDLIQEMGWEIVRQESIKYPGRRSRLWDPEEVYDVLKNNKGTKAVECIVLDVSKIKDLPLNCNSFTKMTELRFLKLHSSEWSKGCKIYLPNGLESLPDKLRLLEWHGYCLRSLPSTFCGEKLVELVMPESKLKKLWDGVQELVNLKEINLNFSEDLVELPDLSMATNLENLYLCGCISLREVHPSILSLHELQVLNLHGCTEIESLETEVHLKSLRIIHVTKCSSLKKFSVFSEKLEVTYLSGSSIHELPSSIWRCEKLTNLHLSGCHNLDGMWSLTELYLDDCCNLRALPDNIKNLLKLETLWLDNCRKLVSLPELPPTLQTLSAINCTSLQTDFGTQLLPVVNMWKHDMISRKDEKNVILSKYVILPGAQIPDMFRFRGEGDTITFPQLPHSDSICGFICCLVLSHIPPDTDNGYVYCNINKPYKSILVTYVCLVQVHTSISDHVLLFSMPEKYDSLACDPNSITFEFSYSEKWINKKIEIKRCGVFPVYYQQQTIPITVSAEPSCKGKLPSFKKKENLRPEKHSFCFTKDDSYIVKTGNQVAQAQAFPEIQESIPAGLAVSNLIWNNMQAPQRIKMFLWKACSGVISVKSELYKWRVAQEPWCFLCRQEPETVSHALLHCSWTRPVWYASQLQLNPSSGGALQDFQIWFMEILDRLKSNKEFLPLGLSILAQTILTIWKERNDCYSQNRQPNPLTVVMKINAQVASSPMINIPASNQSFKKEESSRPEKHTIEGSEGEDLSANQVDNYSDLVMFEKSHTLLEIDNPHLKPVCDPIAEVESMLCDSYKVSPMSTRPTISISQTEAPSPNVKAILEKLETFLETSLEIISSNDEVKRQFHLVLEQLDRFEDEVPVSLHHVICKLKTLIEGFDSRFATAQQTVQDYDQLLQSRSLLAQQLESVKAKQDQIKSKVSELKMQFGSINSEIGEQEKESSVLVEDRDRLKRESKYYEAEDTKLKAQVGQWVPECQNIITALKNSETAYQVAVTNKKKYEDEWAHMKNNFVANKFCWSTGSPDVGSAQLRSKWSNSLFSLLLNCFGLLP